MDRKLPPLQTLTAFEAAARLQSFARAAEELCVTQSAVSHRIRQLESHLQVALFHRLSRQVALTAAGQEFLATVRGVLESLGEAIPRLSHPARRRLRLTCAPAFAHAWLIPRLGRFHDRHPAIELEIHASSQNATLRTGEFDAGLRFGTPPWADTVAHALFDEVLFPVASPAFARAHGPWRTASDLDGRHLVRCRTLPWQPWLEAAGRDGPDPALGPVFNDLDLALRATLEGQGIALLPGSIAAAAIARGELVRACGPDAPSARRYHVVHARSASDRPAMAALVRWLRDEAGAATAQEGSSPPA